MSNEQTTKSTWRDLIPHGRSAMIGTLVVAVVMFFLGALILGSGDSPPTNTVGSEHDSANSAADEPTLWTCSMHPQIQLPKPGKCPICFMDLIPVETGGGGDELDPNQIRMSETAMELARIETTPVVRDYAEREIRMVGKLDYDEAKLSYITAWVPGRLDKLFVDFTGARVAKGDHLVHMYSPELVSTQEELLQAMKAVDALSKTGSSVLKSTAKETLISAREKLRLYGLSEKQIEDIEQSGKASDHLTITAPIGGVVVHKDAKEGMYVSTGTRIYTIADLSKLWAIFEAYESDLPWLRYGQHLTFTSPAFPGEEFDAIISFINPLVNPKTRTVDVRAVVSNKNGRLKPEMFISGLVRSRLDDAGLVIEPSLAGKWISPMHPEIVKDHPGTCDVCGMSLVKAESLGFSSGDTKDNKAPLLIPVSAPLITGKRAVVYVELPSDEQPIFEGRQVVLGPRAGNYYIVKEGLQEGELVVTNGAFRIDSELQIQAKPSMMSPEGGATMSGHQHGQTATGSDTGSQKHANTITYEAGTAKRLDDCEEALIELAPLYDAYFDLQMSLASDNLEEAKDAFVEIVKTAQSVDMELFKDKAHMRWMEISKAIISASQKGEKAKDIAAARDAFYYTSLAAIELHDTFGHPSETNYYLTFCPMARDNAGAFWLQKVDTVYNPFYGESMLRCGSIEKPLPPNGETTKPQSSNNGDPLTKVYHAYFRLQRALTFDDFTEIREAYRQFADEMIALRETDIEDNGLANLAKKGAQSPDLAVARTSFLPVAEEIITLHEKYGHSENKDYYLIHCPHATTNGGASWIQDVDTMYNPFLGGVMANCTEEKQVLPSRKMEGM